MNLTRLERAAALVLLVVAIPGGTGWMLASGGGAEPTAAKAKVNSLVVEVRSAQSGPWSDSKTWEGGKVPGTGMRVRVRSGHRVIYDVKSDAILRSVLIGGTLAFPADRDTLLNTGLINVQPGDAAGETGFDCDDHQPVPEPGQPRAALEVGTAGQPIGAGHSTRIRLHYIPGMARTGRMKPRFRRRSTRSTTSPRLRW